mgnify:CR=1 FL=1|tara:strand:+ start:741 stop:1004 length:264 start_codon:yes stop_codon:yes gene_type:complete
MALIEQTIIDKIEIVGDFKNIQVREDRQIIDDTSGEIKARDLWHRYVLSPGDDISGQPDDVQAVANAVWTDAVKAAYAEYRDSVSKV